MLDSRNDNPTQNICKGFFDIFIYGVFMGNLIAFDDIFANGIASSGGIYGNIEKTLLVQTPYMWKYDFMNLASDKHRIMINSSYISQSGDLWIFGVCVIGQILKHGWAMKAF